MSQSRILQQHIDQLSDLRGILHALKNMAFMDMHKLNKYQRSQRLAVRHIETAAADFLKFYPGFPEENTSQPTVVIAVGSERGFCGNFNESLIARLMLAPPDTIIAVGGRLSNRLQNTPLDFIGISGANSSEEINRVLGALTDAVGKMHQQYGYCNLSVLFHRDEHLNITLKSLLPPFKELDRPCAYTIEPLLNLEPAEFLLELIEQYVFSSLQDILYTSLLAENNQRLQHLDNAVRHLDESTEKLHKKSQIYRQEEITEEIEVILLNADERP